MGLPYPGANAIFYVAGKKLLSFFGDTHIGLKDKMYLSHSSDHQKCSVRPRYALPLRQCKHLGRSL